jgi:hypothetical protein
MTEWIYTYVHRRYKMYDDMYMYMRMRVRMDCLSEETLCSPILIFEENDIGL